MFYKCFIAYWKGLGAAGTISTTVAVLSLPIIAIYTTIAVVVAVTIAIGQTVLLLTLLLPLQLIG